MKAASCISATVPVTKGVAMLVPESVLYGLLGSFHVLKIRARRGHLVGGRLVPARRGEPVGRRVVLAGDEADAVAVAPEHRKCLPAPVSAQVLATLSVP